jgi:copper/silver efflux system protein
VIGGVVAWSGRHARAVLLVAALVAGASYHAWRSLPRDVIPDLSDPQVVLLAEWMGHPAHEVATSVTEVLTGALADVPGATAIRGSSMSGMAYVDVVFASASDLPRGRREIGDRIGRLRPRLPRGVRVLVGPEASSTGWVLQYAIVAPDLRGTMGQRPRESPTSLRALRKLQDQVLRPALAEIPGVAEVASVGGDVEQVLVETTPDQLRGAGVALSDVVSALRGALDAGGAATVAALQAAPLALPAGDPGAGGRAPVVGDLARVSVAPGMASGMADINGMTPVVGGIVVARSGADVATLVEQVKQVLARERHRLPTGVKLGIVYDRSELAARVARTLVRAVAEEIVVVAAVVLMFLLHGRSALVPALTLPLVVLMTFAALRLLGVSATVMSLGGIAIALGMAVDADLVALEACHRRLEGGGATGAGRRAAMVAAAGSLAPAILTSLVIAALAFVPVFAFGGETGRLLRPLALTKTLVVAAAALVTLTVAPALRDVLLRGRLIPELGNPVTRTLVRAYRPFVHFALARPGFTLVTAALAGLSCLPIAFRLGGEFLPRLDEGDLFFMPTTSPGVTAGDAGMALQRQDRAIAARPEVAVVFGKVGRADTATDPAPFSMAETTVRLRPRAEWPALARTRWYSGWAPEPVKRLLRPLWPEATPATTAELIEILDRATRLSGWSNAWTAPIRARMDMMSTGVRTPVGIRIVARDRARLAALGEAVQRAAAAVPGTRSAVYESLGGETRLAFEPDAGALARHRVDPDAVRAMADLLIAGGQVGELPRPGGQGPLPGDRLLAVRVALAAPWAPRPPQDLIREATVRGAGGTGPPVPLALLGRPRFVTGPAMLRAEGGEPVAYVYVDLLDSTNVAGWVHDARARVEQGAGVLQLAPGERIEWTGQYELLASGQRRLMVIAPVVAFLMLALLLLQFRNLTEALIVLVSVPFALVGSFWTLYLLDYRLSAPVWVGLLSVVGLAMQTGVVMVVYIDEAFHGRVRDGLLRTRADIVAAHAEGTVRRLRPKLMTITTMAAGLLPLLWAQGAGAEIMRRVAAPMIGGLVTSAFLTLEVIPVLYTIWRHRQLRASQRRGIPLAQVVGAAPSWARGNQ